MTDFHLIEHVYGVNKKRWAFSALATILLLAVFFFLPVWKKIFKSSVSVSLSQPSATVSYLEFVPKESPAVAAPQPQKNTEKAAEKIPEEIVEKQAELPPEPEIAEEAASENQSEAEAATESFEESDAAAAQASSAEGFGALEHERLVNSYEQYALSRISANKIYPLSARAKGLEGEVRVRAAINRDGTLKFVELVSSSGSELLDEAALRAVKKSEKFKRFPPEMPGESLLLEFIMEFHIT